MPESTNLGDNTQRNARCMLLEHNAADTLAHIKRPLEDNGPPLKPRDKDMVSGVWTFTKSCILVRSELLDTMAMKLAQTAWETIGGLGC